MNPFRIAAVIAAALCACATIPVFAQTAIEPDTGKPGVARPAAKPVAKTPTKKAARNVAAKKPATQRTQSPPAPGATMVLRQGSTYSTGPTTLRDRQGNVIPTNPEAYAVDSARPGK